MRIDDEDDDDRRIRMVGIDDEDASDVVRGGELGDEGTGGKTSRRTGSQRATRARIRETMRGRRPQ